MSEPGSNGVVNGTRKLINGKNCIYYDAYWIRYYDPPKNNLVGKKTLIDQLTKRLFHQAESGINTPGDKLEQARRVYDAEQEPRRKRVKAAMLAGALFNRATDIFTSIVELEGKSISVDPKNELMRQCSECFKEALFLGRQVKHYSGEEGIDELWGEPFKAFVMPIEAYYASRYIKIAQTMRDIDHVKAAFAALFQSDALFDGMVERIESFADAAKRECETMKSDADNFEVWPAFVANGEILVAFQPPVSPTQPGLEQLRITEGLSIIRTGRDLISYIATARVPMPKSTKNFIERCERYQKTWHISA